jgi:hypothetical protein
MLCCNGNSGIFLLLSDLFVSTKCVFLCINNQQDASSSQNFILSQTVHVSGIFCAHHQESSAVRVAFGVFHAGYVAAA